MKKLLFALMGIAILFPSIYTPLSDPQFCEVRILLDAHSEYDINLSEIERLLQDNGFPCPYILDLTIWDQVELDRILHSDGRASIAKYTIYPNGHHIISSYLVHLPLAAALGRDFSVLNSLSRAKWGTWIILHELGHMMWNGNGWDYSDATELWCDNFANQNYNQYAIIVEERND